MKTEKIITQKHAKVLIRDYLRETKDIGGMSHLMGELKKHFLKLQARGPDKVRMMFTQRGLEVWLEKQKRQMQYRNWEVLLSFIQADRFKLFISKTVGEESESKLIKVADGLFTLYESWGIESDMTPLYELPSVLFLEGTKAIQKLEGYWGHDNDSPISYNQSYMKVKHIPNKPYAKFARIIKNSSNWGNAVCLTGLIFYINTVNKETRGENTKKYHYYVLHGWLRKVHQYNRISSCSYKILINLEDSVNDVFSEKETFFVQEYGQYQLASMNPTKRNQMMNVGFGRNKAPVFDGTGEEYLAINKNLDILVEDVLPHG